MAAKKKKPRITIDHKLAHKLAKMACTNEEIAACLNISAKYFYDVIKRDPELSDMIQKGRAEGRASLRRAQWAKALEGNPTMLIWLGKQLLGQSDMSRTEITGKDGEAIQIEEQSGTAREFIEAAITRVHKLKGESEDTGQPDTPTTH